MTADATVATRLEDPVSNVLKWVLLAVATGTFGILAWTVDLTYKAAPPFPDRFVTSNNTVLMTAGDVQAGKNGFQKADLINYGSLYGMGSYFGEDYTAANLVCLATLTQENIAQSTLGRAVAQLSAEQQASVKVAMQMQLHSIDLTQRIAVIHDALAAAMTTSREQYAQSLLHHDFAKG